MRILDLSDGKRAAWFDKNYRDAVFVDIRPEVEPTFVASLGDTVQAVADILADSNTGCDGGLR